MNSIYLKYFIFFKGLFWQSCFHFTIRSKFVGLIKVSLCEEVTDTSKNSFNKGRILQGICQELGKWMTHNRVTNHFMSGGFQLFASYKGIELSAATTLRTGFDNKSLCEFWHSERSSKNWVIAGTQLPPILIHMNNW